MMKKRRILVITGLFLFISTTLRLVWIAYQLPPEHPQAIQGVLDLRGWDFSSSQPIPLEGEWEFYPNKLLTGDISVSPHQQSLIGKSTYIKVPGDWSTVLHQQSREPIGYGSYRLRIRVTPEEVRSYGIQLKASTSSAVYVNGERLGQSGQPAVDKEQYSARTIPYSVSFSSIESELDLIVQVANYHNPKYGGLVISPTLGDEKAISKVQMISISMQLLMCAIFLIHIVYGCILFMVGFRQKSLIYLLLAALCAILMTLVDDDQLLFSWLPFHYEWIVKALFLSYIGVALFLLLGLRELLPEFRTSKFVQACIRVLVLYSAFVLLMPAKYTLLTTVLFYMIYTSFFLCIPVITFRMVLRNSEDVTYLIFVTISFSCNVIWGFVKSMGWINDIYYPFDLIIAFIAFASFWFRRFIRSTEQTKDLAQQLQKANKQKDDFLANTSHELRTPLHGVINIAQTVLEEEKGTLDNRNVQNLELLITVGRRMSLMLNDLLDLSQLREGRIHLQLQSVRVQSVASGVFDMLRYTTDGKPLLLKMGIPESFPAVVADEKRLVQILFNLVHNAIKFTDEGTVTIVADIDGDYAYIRVMDTGIGMDKELQQKVFQAYEQGEAGRTESVGGIGLGLRICEQLVQLHGGILKVDSVPGHGSVFTFNLRLCDIAAQGESENRTVVTALAITHSEFESYNEVKGNVRENVKMLVSTACRPKILIVDDDSVNLKILGDILSSEQYEVMKAMNGKEAISKLDNEQWDLIIADVMMPNMSGYELTRHIRERFSLSEIPILLLTARNNVEDIHSGFTAGANDYVTKPVDAIELRSRVRALTDLKKSVNERLRMEAAYLQAQIQPHFLFNTLNSITALSDFDTNKMNDLIEAFSSYLRISFDFLNQSQLVPIEHELELVRSYLYIEKERFEDRLHIEWELDYNDNVMMPPLTIQPLVENAVRHGVIGRAQGGTVHIRIVDNHQGIDVEIIDNGKGMEDTKVKELLHFYGVRGRGIGLLNTDRRLKQLYGKGLTIKSKLGQGTTVSFIIPK